VHAQNDRRRLAVLATAKRAHSAITALLATGQRAPR